jgi:hypothetical protein
MSSSSGIVAISNVVGKDVRASQPGIDDEMTMREKYVGYICHLADTHQWLASESGRGW